MTRSRLPVIIYSVAAVLALLGLAEATYLTVAALTGETVLCGNSASCFEVLGSRYARIGRIPMAALGALAYFTVFSLATFAVFGYGRVRLFFNGTVIAMFAVTLWLLYVQAFLLHAFCRYCLFSAALIFMLMAIAVVVPTRPQQA
jgi:uncharacterized membrane protein